MRLRVVLLIPVVCLLSVTPVIGVGVELDYYWVEYNGGKIPKNALMLDPTRNGEYLGQVYTKEYELLPAIIRTSPPYATFEAYDKVLTSNRNIKVLCSIFPEYFKWIPSTHDTYRSVPNKVLAGHEVGEQVFFGKYIKNGKMTMGKVFTRTGVPYKSSNFVLLVYRIGDYTNNTLTVPGNIQIMCLKLNTID